MRLSVAECYVGEFQQRFVPNVCCILLSYDVNGTDVKFFLVLN